MRVDYSNCEACMSRNICRFADANIQFVKSIAETFNKDHEPEWVHRIFIECAYFQGYPVAPPPRQQVQVDFDWSKHRDYLSSMNPTFFQQQPQSQAPNFTPEQVAALRQELNRQAMEAKQHLDGKGQQSPQPPEKQS